MSDYQRRRIMQHMKHFRSLKRPPAESAKPALSPQSSQASSIRTSSTLKNLYWDCDLKAVAARIGDCAPFSCIRLYWQHELATALV